MKKNAASIKGFIHVIQNKPFERQLYYKFMSLPLLPADKIVNAFEMLKEKTLSAQDVGRIFKDFLRYFERQWIRKVCFLCLCFLFFFFI